MIERVLAIVIEIGRPARSCQYTARPAQIDTHAFASRHPSHRRCEAWRLRLLAYLQANRDHAASALRRMGLDVVLPEASYLMWIDASAVLPEGANAVEIFSEGGVALSGGESFGGSPRTCRLNFACRRETLDEALRLMEAALRSARA